jgi:hypothetical protein
MLPSILKKKIKLFFNIFFKLFLNMNVWFLFFMLFSSFNFILFYSFIQLILILLLLRDLIENINLTRTQGIDLTYRSNLMIISKTFRKLFCVQKVFTPTRIIPREVNYWHQKKIKVLINGDPFCMMLDRFFR